MDESDDIIDSSLVNSPGKQKCSYRPAPGKTIGSASDDSDDYVGSVQRYKQSQLFCSDSGSDNGEPDRLNALNDVVIDSSSEAEDSDDDHMVTANESLLMQTPYEKRRKTRSFISHGNREPPWDSSVSSEAGVKNAIRFEDSDSDDSDSGVIHSSDHVQNKLEGSDRSDVADAESFNVSLLNQIDDLHDSDVGVIQSSVQSNKHKFADGSDVVDAEQASLFCRNQIHDSDDRGGSVSPSSVHSVNELTFSDGSDEAGARKCRRNQIIDSDDSDGDVSQSLGGQTDHSNEDVIGCAGAHASRQRESCDGSNAAVTQTDVDFSVGSARVSVGSSIVSVGSSESDIDNSIVKISTDEDSDFDVEAHFRKVETRQTTLNEFSFRKPVVKNEASVSEASQSGAFSDLPTTDATISGFGKKAMQTHLSQKTLTVEALTELHTALKSCPSEDTYADDPNGLKVELMPHQKHALAWLLWREKEKPPGGILADDMGLGKTLTMISLILKSREEHGTNEHHRAEDSDSEDNNDGESHDRKWLSTRRSRMPRGGTLIVCPASLLGQWEGEIKNRCSRKLLSVQLYHGAYREHRPRKLARYDIVITTYNLIGRESGVETPKNATQIKEKGPLHLIRWERIVLDEAHIVRNHKSLTALGVVELVGRSRWCLTGTPIQNRELDLYSLMKFLRCSPFDDLAVWKRWVDNKNAAGMQRLSTMMKSLMLRRTKEQLQAKGDLKHLPEKNSEEIDVHLDPEELELYEKVALFSKTLFAQFLNQRAEKQQLLDAKYGFSNLPTWQQGERPDNQFFTTEELAQMHIQMQGLREVKASEILVVLLRLRQICCHPGLIKAMIEKEDFAGSAVKDETAEGVNDETGLDIDLFDQMNSLTISEPHSETMKEMILEDKGKRAKVMSLDNPVLNFERPSAKCIYQEPVNEKTSHWNCSRAVFAPKFCFFTISSVTLFTEADIEFCSKKQIRAVLDILGEKVLGTDDKAVVVSQWTSMLRIVWDCLKRKKVRCEMLCGDVPVSKRQDIVADFNRSFGGPQVLLLSLTAGGVGLNLVGGNHLILIDIHWNPQLEAQAQDRIYRVGQKKPVFIYKFITVNTIEERIKALQEQKLAVANSVLTGSKNTQGSKLSMDDLKMLFSME